MQVFIIACLIAVAAAARLDNTYLPPSGAKGSGGGGGILSAPGRGGGAGGGGGGGGARSAEAGAKILRYDNNNDGLGSYQYQYETENKIKAEESGELKNAGSENEALSAHGSFSYTGPDGATYSISYIADENGFQPTGDHLPTPPPIPEAILKSIQLNAAAEGAGGAGGSGVGGGYVPPGQSFSPQSGYKY